ncbi:nuclear transport factor 2 family protein [Gramella sp. GC03-9]|uniref:Nuclear transport factor 2 family protein n=1 Tax=Christiangramia oceanisediminis TaxID=2920386 RepID=A0A9X2KWV0_9FLAO|nr:nuclear transport factor 2 family protein [Gramella oceanisediminis]MCP9200024.1 nuclear transport factor 2 family protein [Gramella oceanisediminis]
MKRILISLFAGLLMISCNNQQKESEPERYSQDSEEINTLKSAISDYEKGDWEAMKKHYADTAQVFHNSKQGKKIGEIVTQHQESLSDLPSYGFVDEDNDFEMVLTNDGHTWVNFWGDWKATLPRSNQEVIVPVHLTAQFKDGKIVREHGYWDSAIMSMAMQQNDTVQETPE